MNVDTNAPVFARKEIIIDAPIETVWNIQTGINRWSEWQSDITSVKMDGELKAGTIFRWKAKGLSIVSTLHTVEPNRRIGWTGISLGMSAIHNWTFEALGNVTRVVTEESLNGWLTRLMKLFDPHFLDKSLEASLKILRRRVESDLKKKDI
jgi:uncharacterized membrane protein